MISPILFVLGTISGLAVAAPSSGQLAQPSPGACTPLVSLQGTSFERWSVRVYRPGSYCLSQGLKQTELPAWLRLPHMAVPHDPLMVSESGNVSIDLAGHSMVTTTAAGQGMMHLGGAAWTDGKEHPRMQAARNISLRNGSISTKFQPAVIMANRWNGDNQRFDGKKVGGHFLLGARLTDSRGDIDRYESTDYVLENLTLTSDQIVVLMQGKNNIIRRCKIIGANAAVNLYGPNLVFEDNEIVMTARDPADAGGEPQVALYVEDGFGAVIRNNRFVIKGRPDGAVAMEFRNAAGVVLEGNTVEGKASLYRTLDEKSTVEVRPAMQQAPLATRHQDPRETQ